MVWQDYLIEAHFLKESGSPVHASADHARLFANAYTTAMFNSRFGFECEKIYYMHTRKISMNLYIRSRF